MTSQATKRNTRSLLTILWIFLSLNYIYCDHLSIMEPESFAQLAQGQVSGVAVTQTFFLSAALILEIPFIMVVLTHVLKHRAARWASIIAGLVMTLIQVGTMGIGGAPSLV